MRQALHVPCTVVGEMLLFYTGRWSLTGVGAMNLLLNKTMDSSTLKRNQLHFSLLIEASFFNSYQYLKSSLFPETRQSQWKIPKLIREREQQQAIPDLWTLFHSLHWQAEGKTKTEGMQQACSIKICSLGKKKSEEPRLYLQGEQFLAVLSHLCSSTSLRGTVSTHQRCSGPSAHRRSRWGKV